MPPPHLWRRKDSQMRYDAESTPPLRVGRECSRRVRNSAALKEFVIRRTHPFAGLRTLQVGIPLPERASGRPEAGLEVGNEGSLIAYPARRPSVAPSVGDQNLIKRSKRGRRGKSQCAGQTPGSIEKRLIQIGHRGCSTQLRPLRLLPPCRNPPCSCYTSYPRRSDCHVTSAIDTP